MFSTLRTRFGIPGTIAVVALVLAMAGGAYAAAKLSSQEKKEVAKIAKKFAGKAGPVGPAGPQGPGGANGKDGANGGKGEKGDPGTNGANGTNGKNIVTGTESPSANCEAGGFWGEVEGQASTKHFACNGTSITNTSEPKGAHCAEGGTKLEGTSTTYACNGSPWTAGGSLPSGATETGAWSFAGIGAEGTQLGNLNSAQVSFTIPLSAPLSVSNSHYIPPGEAGTVEPTNCPGTVEEPKAAPGQLCVYAKFAQEVAAQIIEPLGTSGALLLFLVSNSKANGGGSWAVSGPPAS